jgi:menaquinone-9 beta-reductase
VSSTYDYEVIIVGGGPAGATAAFQLTNLDPNLGPRILLVDKAIFPRFKLCAGGLTNAAEAILAELGLEPTVRMIPVHVSRFVLPQGVLTLRQTSHFQVVNRIEFDHWLLLSVKKRGVAVHEGVKVEKVTAEQNRITVRTGNGDYSCKMVIAADGARSTVRRSVGLARRNRLMMALEITAGQTGPPFTHDDDTAVFDFRVMNNGLFGYCWSFPSIGEPGARSFGILEAPFLPEHRVNLKDAFSDWLAERNLKLDNFELCAHPALRYQPADACSCPRVLFAGDAAGVEPLFGEGITSALGLGKLAAQSAFDAIRSDDFSFSDYDDRIRVSPTGIMMRRRHAVARKLHCRHTISNNKFSFPEILAWVSPNDSETASSITWESI